MNYPDNLEENKGNSKSDLKNLELDFTSKKSNLVAKRMPLKVEIFNVIPEIESQELELKKVTQTKDESVNIFEYDDLSPSKNFYLISDPKFANRFKNDWAKFDNIKFKRVLEVILAHQPHLAEFVLTKIDKPTVHHLARLDEAEIVDFVLNKYNFHEEVQFHEVILPTDRDVKVNLTLAKVAIKDLAASDNANNSKAFKNQTINYFLKQKIKNQNQAITLNNKLLEQKADPSIKTNFLKPVQEISTAPVRKSLGRLIKGKLSSLYPKRIAVRKAIIK